MRIYFCDLCNESVPQIDLDRGTAVLRTGRVVCARCESAMTGESDVEESLGEPDAAAAPEPAGGFVPRVGDETTVVDTRGFVSPRPEVGSTSSTGAAVGVALASVALILAVSASAFLYDQIEGRNQELLQSLEQDRLDAADRESRFQARLDALLREAAADGSNSRVRGCSAVS